MDQTILSGLFALSGAVIGGIVTISATVISNRKHINLELKKQRIEFLNTKKNALENFATELSTFTMSPDNAHRLEKIHNLFYLTEHYLNDEPDFENIKKYYEEMINNTDMKYFNIQKTNIDKLTYICAAIQGLVRHKLCKIMNELNKELIV